MTVPRPDHSQRGFSLLELLLALVVIGLIFAMAGVSVGTGNRPYKIEAALNEFMDITQYALDEAQFRGVDMGLLVERHGGSAEVVYRYQWLERYDFNRWRPARFDVDALGVRLLPEDMDVVLEVEEGEITLSAETETVEDEEELRPQAIFYSSGETTPGIMVWSDPRSGEVLWELEWDLVGRLSKRRFGLEQDDE